MARDTDPDGSYKQRLLNRRRFERAQAVCSSCSPHHYVRRRILVARALVIDRQGCGVPHIELPAASAPLPHLSPLRQSLRKTLKTLRTDRQSTPLTDREAVFDMADPTSTSSAVTSGVDDAPISPVQRRDSLEKHLQQRPDPQDLKDKHILLDTTAAPYVHAPSPFFPLRPHGCGLIREARGTGRSSQPRTSLSAKRPPTPSRRGSRSGRRERSWSSATSSQTPRPRPRCRATRRSSRSTCAPTALMRR